MKSQKVSDSDNASTSSETSSVAQMKPTFAKKPKKTKVSAPVDPDTVNEQPQKKSKKLPVKKRAILHEDEIHESDVDDISPVKTKKSRKTVTFEKTPEKQLKNSTKIKIPTAPKKSTAPPKQKQSLTQKKNVKSLQVVDTSENDQKFREQVLAIIEDQRLKQQQHHYDVRKNLLPTENGDQVEHSNQLYGMIFKR